MMCRACVQQCIFRLMSPHVHTWGKVQHLLEELLDLDNAPHKACHAVTQIGVSLAVRL
jgi:hypothetical protein